MGMEGDQGNQDAKVQSASFVGNDIVFTVTDSESVGSYIGGSTTLYGINY